MELLKTIKRFGSHFAQILCGILLFGLLSFQVFAAYLSETDIEKIGEIMLVHEVFTGADRQNVVDNADATIAAIVESEGFDDYDEGGVQEAKDLVLDRLDRYLNEYLTDAVSDETNRILDELDNASELERASLEEELDSLPTLSDISSIAKQVRDIVVARFDVAIDDVLSGEDRGTTGIGGTILPPTSFTQAVCEDVMIWVNRNIVDQTVDVGLDEFAEFGAKSAIAKREKVAVEGVGIVTGNDILGCGIKTGDIKLWMIPFYIRFVLEFIIGIAGLITVGGIVYGGYLYLFAGLSDDKDKGKNAIKNGIIGLILVLTAWAIVNIVIGLVTL